MVSLLFMIFQDCPPPSRFSLIAFTTAPPFDVSSMMSFLPRYASVFVLTPAAERLSFSFMPRLRQPAASLRLMSAARRYGCQPAPPPLFAAFTISPLMPVVFG